MNNLRGILAKNSTDCRTTQRFTARQKTAAAKYWVQLVYLLKTGHGQTITQTTQMIGQNRVTLYKWIRQYSSGGIEGLLKQKSSLLLTKNHSKLGRKTIR